MKIKNIKPALVLGVICLVSALSLSVVNVFTGPVIEKMKNDKANAALLVVLPEGRNFEPIELVEGYPETVKAAYRADGGFVFRVEVTGKEKGLIVMIGINEQGKIVGTTVIANDETPSYSADVFSAVEGTDGAYAGMDLASFSPYLVSGATLTSAAYGEAVKAALQSFGVANGQDVDIRTPEQILQDNCNAAMGTEGAVFTKWFAVEVLEGIDAVYVSEKVGGAVYKIGETFVGVGLDGAIVTADVSEELAATVTAANGILTGSKRTVLETLPDGVHKSIKKVQVTESGNYEFEVEGEGFSVHQYDEYTSGSNTPMTIRVSITADGKILDCLTVSHDESKGYGDKSATEEYYEGWRGVGADDVKVGNSGANPGVITGATYTAEGYQKAVKRAFDAFKILTGGEEQ